MFIYMRLCSSASATHIIYVPRGEYYSEKGKTHRENDLAFLLVFIMAEKPVMNRFCDDSLTESFPTYVFPI